MVKLAISLYALCLAYSAPLNVQFSFLSTYGEELKTTLTNLKTEVKFVINEARMMVAEYKKLLKTLHGSAAFVQKEVSDSINNTMTGLGKKVSNFLADTSVDVSKCIALTSTIESTATDILIDTNTCIHDKLNKAEVYIEKSITSVEYTLARLESLKNIADDSFAKLMKNKNMITIFQTKMFLKSISPEPSQVITKMLSTLTDTTLAISRMESLMISDCVSTEAILSLINDTRRVYSRIKTCTADLNSSDANLQSLSANSRHLWKR